LERNDLRLLTGHAAVIGAWQLLERDGLVRYVAGEVTLRLLERDDRGHCIRHLQVTLRLLGRNDPGHRTTSLTGHSAFIGAWRPSSRFLERDWLAGAAKTL